MIKIKIALVGALLISLTACSTVKGLGKDIESVGSKGEEVIKGK
jgi:predicted small secreted protein